MGTKDFSGKTVFIIFICFCHNILAINFRRLRSDNAVKEKISDIVTTSSYVTREKIHKYLKKINMFLVNWWFDVLASLGECWIVRTFQSRRV